MSDIKFSRQADSTFYATLKKRVDNYFIEKNISRFGNSSMVLKTIFTLAMYLGPLAFIILVPVNNVWLYLAIWLLIGLGKSAVGMCVMHDANHGSYSSKKWVNFLLSQTMNLLGGNSNVWKIQHNVLHHTFTNVDGVDDDLEGPGFMRFSPHQPKKPIHKYQHLFAYFPYSLMTYQRLFKSDFAQVFRYSKEGLLSSDTTLTWQFIQVALWKLIYVGVFLVLPIMTAPFHWSIVLLGFSLMHLVAGEILSLIFQSAHVMPDNLFPLPNEEGLLEEHWAIHQMQTTTNFARKSPLFSWFVGGLNYQVEHHLFMNICHVHYKNLSPIVQETAKEFGVPYNFEPTFRAAVKSHIKMLKDLGNS
ncbi:MAG: linoleoyl-CoA desaturase [Candidatus Azotimanducaceae bacterium]|jgi:linoleoyl-CoA desaturase